MRRYESTAGATPCGQRSARRRHRAGAVLLDPVKAGADVVIDTSELLNVHQLRPASATSSAATRDHAMMQIRRSSRSASSTGCPSTSTWSSTVVSRLQPALGGRNCGCCRASTSRAGVRARPAHDRPVPRPPSACSACCCRRTCTGKVVPDHRLRLHRRAPPLGGHRRGGREQLRQRGEHPGRQPPRHRPLTAPFWQWPRPAGRGPRPVRQARGAPVTAVAPRPRVAAVGVDINLAASFGGAALTRPRSPRWWRSPTDGGSSGRLREVIDQPPPGDLRTCLAARRRRRSPGRWSTGSRRGSWRPRPGNLLYRRSGRLGGTVAAVDEVARLVGAVGRVLPATTEPVVPGAGGVATRSRARWRSASTGISRVASLPTRPAGDPGRSRPSGADQVVIGLVSTHERAGGRGRARVQALGRGGRAQGVRATCRQRGRDRRYGRRPRRRPAPPRPWTWTWSSATRAGLSRRIAGEVVVARRPLPGTGPRPEPCSPRSSGHA